LAFYLLSFVTGGIEPVDNLQDRFSQKIGWNVSTVIKLKREQDLVSPQFAAHMLPFLEL